MLLGDDNDDDDDRLMRAARMVVRPSMRGQRQHVKDVHHPMLSFYSPVVFTCNKNGWPCHYHAPLKLGSDGI